MSVIDEIKQAGVMLENGLHCGGFAKLKVSNGEKRRPAMRAKAGIDQRLLEECLISKLYSSGSGRS